MKNITIGLVGPCTSGKSTIRTILESLGYRVRHIAQEHSFAPRMWRQISNPDVLVFLDVSYAVTLQRRKWNWKVEDYEEQQRRLAHARQHADILIDTDRFSPEEIAKKINDFVS